MSLLVRFLPHRLARPLGRLLGATAGAARLEAASAARFDLVRFCHHLTLEGWEHLAEAEGRGRGMVVVFPPLGLVEIAPLPLGVYGGPLHLWGGALLDGLPRGACRRFRLQPVANEEEARRLLAAGGRVGVPWRTAEQRRRATDLAVTVGAPILPVVCLPEPRGRWRLVVRPAATPRPEEDPQALARTVDEEIAKGSKP